MGGAAATSSFARLFLLAGVAHCGGGQSPDTFDALTATTGRVTKGEVSGCTAVKVGKRVNGNRANGKRVVTKAKN